MARAMLDSASWMAASAISRGVLPNQLGEGLERGCSGGGVQVHLAAKEGGGLHGAADHMGVGDRRRAPAFAVAGGARVCAGTLGADAQHAAVICPDQRPAAGARPSPYR